MKQMVNQDTLWPFLQKAHNENYLIGCSFITNRMGLMAEHAYGILDMQETDLKGRTERLLKIRLNLFFFCYFIFLFIYFFL